MFLVVRCFLGLDLGFGEGFEMFFYLLCDFKVGFGFIRFIVVFFFFS